jgi:hypothetical protein
VGGVDIDMPECRPVDFSVPPRNTTNADPCGGLHRLTPVTQTGRLGSTGRPFLRDGAGLGVAREERRKMEERDGRGNTPSRYRSAAAPGQGLDLGIDDLGPHGKCGGPRRSYPATRDFITVRVCVRKGYLPHCTPVAGCRSRSRVRPMSASRNSAVIPQRGGGRFSGGY